MLEEINRYHHPLLRDLAWILLSPSLIDSDDDFFRKQYQETRSLFADWERNPEELEAQITPWPGHRLGKYHEMLWAFWINKNPRFVLLEKNLQLNHEGITLGEFDFILRDLETKKICHWEVAVKFYLGYNDTSKTSSWYGLKFDDRFDNKLKRLLNQQSQLSKRPEAKELLKDKQIDEVRVILKGRLFYPPEVDTGPAGSQPQHLRSRWVKLSDFLNNSEEHSLEWWPLKKHSWLADCETKSTLKSFEQLKEELQKGCLEIPHCLAAFKEGREIKRLFLLPDDWQGPQ
jgi:hypothetical protein